MCRFKMPINSIRGLGALLCSNTILGSFKQTGSDRGSFLSIFISKCVLCTQCILTTYRKVNGRVRVKGTRPGESVFRFEKITSLTDSGCTVMTAPMTISCFQSEKYCILQKTIGINNFAPVERNLVCCFETSRLF